MSIGSKYFTKVHTGHCEKDIEVTDLYCPGCGACTVYVEKGEGDYYEGQCHYCPSCNCEFYLPSCGKNEKLTFRNE